MGVQQPEEKPVVYWGKPVEVRKTPNSVTWYHAVLVDIKSSEMAKVRFPREENALHYLDIGFTVFEASDPELSYTWSEKVLKVEDCVRERKTHEEESDWTPEVGDLVEILFEPDSNYPGGWALGKITGDNQGFYFVKFEEDPTSAFTQQENNTVIVKKNVLRRVLVGDSDIRNLGWNRSEEEKQRMQNKAVTNTKGLCVQILKKTLVLSDSSDGDDLFSTWLQSDNGRSLFFHLKLKYDLLFIAPAPELVYMRDDNGVKTKNPVTEISLFSTTEHMFEQVSLIIQVHWYHQTRINQFAKAREQKLDNLLAFRKKVDQGRTVTVNIPAGCVGMLIGKKGQNVRDLEKKYAIEVQIDEKDSLKDSLVTQDGMRRVTLFGFDAAALEEARKLCEFVEVDIPLTQDQFKWLKTKCNLAQLAKQTEETGQITISNQAEVEKRRAVTLRGTPNAVEEAKTVLEGHLSYFSEYKSMDKKRDELSSMNDKLKNDYGVKQPNAKQNPKGKSKAAAAKSKSRAKDQKKDESSEKN